MDAMAVSLCAGASGQTASRRSSLRLAWHFGFFQAAMPVLGWFGGRSVADWISGFDHWIAFGLLLFVAIRMVRSGLGFSAESAACDPTRGSTMVLLSIATSIDALAVGFSFALLGTDIFLPALAIGVITFALSYFATRIGKRLNLAAGKVMEIAGGAVLALIGLRILLSHLLGGG